MQTLAITLKIGIVNMYGLLAMTEPFTLLVATAKAPLVPLLTLVKPLISTVLSATEVVASTRNYLL